MIDCIPVDRLEWTPKPGRFALGEQVRHLATIERYMYGETIAGRPSAYPGCGEELAHGMPAVLGYLERFHIEFKQILTGLGDDALTRKCLTPADSPITVWKWLRAMAEHEAHRRGQIYLMLGMLDLPTPPLFGLTSEEVKARSK